MYRWYQRSHICYAYLQDRINPGSSVGNISSWLRNSRWFLRGWTLQELIAPGTVEFYTPDWKLIGTKASLSEALSNITGIPQNVLCGHDSLSTCTVAERISWAAARSTTRDEDLAYCLLGLFNVKMSIVYGEGLTSAFFRLQERIIKLEKDYTIFAWHQGGPSWTGVLASSPHQFSRRPAHQDSELPFLAASAYLTQPRPPLGRESGTPFSVWEAIEYPRLRLTDIDGEPSLAMAREQLRNMSCGIRAHLFALKPRDDAPYAPTLVWLYCTLGGGLVCVPLRPTLPPMPPWSSIRRWDRSAPPSLVIVDPALLEMFVP